MVCPHVFVARVAARIHPALDAFWLSSEYADGDSITSRIQPRSATLVIQDKTIQAKANPMFFWGDGSGFLYHLNRFIRKLSK